MAITETAMEATPDIAVSEIEKRFMRINQHRFARTYESLNAKQQDVLDILPYLIHVNSAELPGYVSDYTPSGISSYAPTQKTINTLQRLYPEYKAKRMARHHVDIESLFCMGSSGTIAYSSHSDFDIWLIHSQDLGSESIEELADKALLLEEWALNYRLEVHFFVFDDLSFKDGQHENLSSESSGSAQHYLLLDEFYRSSLLIAGKPPFWWLVPSDPDIDYETFKQSLIEREEIDINDYVDFGNVASIPADEFFSAAVWQLYKGIDSPYKSVLKLLLMEAYASEYPDIKLLSSMYKNSVFKGENNLSKLDPYLIMYNKVAKYLKIQKESERLDLYRKCFYFKVNIRMSQRIKNSDNWRRDIMQELIRNWSWDSQKIQYLDNVKHWQIDLVLKERNLLINAFTKSYKFLSQFARTHTEVSRVKESELNILGRKLYAAFEKKPGKVEIINRGIATDILENEISIVHNIHNGTDRFFMYRGNLEYSEGDVTNSPLKRAPTLIDLISWGFFNHIIDQDTAISLSSNELDFSARDVKDILTALNQVYPYGKLHKPSFYDLSHPSRLDKAVLFVNVGVRPETGKENQQGDHLSSNRKDILSYGGFRKNLAISFDLVVTNNWEEIQIYHYTENDGLLTCLSDYIRFTINNTQTEQARISAFSFGSSYSMEIGTRIEELFSSITSTYSGDCNSVDNQYLFILEDKYYLSLIENEQLTYTTIENEIDLLKAFGRPTKIFKNIHFDKHVVWNSPIPYVYSMNKAQSLQLFFTIIEGVAFIYILDERGALFHQKIPYYDSKSLIFHFALFFKAINQRKNLLCEKNENETLSIEYYMLSKTAQNEYSSKLIEVTPNPEVTNFYNIHVVGELGQNNLAEMTIYCGNNEFSTVEFGDQLFNEVANHVLKQRKSGQTYPIYITDIDLSSNLLAKTNHNTIQTVTFLDYKKRIESKLNKALNQNTLT